MRLKRNLLMVILVIVTLIATGCYGNFTLTRKIYNWNGNVGDKVVQSAVGWGLVILPIYSGAMFIDAVALNLIEFWTGENPLAMNVGDIDSRIITTDKGSYELIATPNRFDLVALDGESVGDYLSLLYSPENEEWVLENDGNSQVVVKFHGKTVELIYPSGKTEFYNM
ncbi:DUF3332 family protein [bacterium]|nr:DUF3332 family protein [bacterium]